MKSNKNRQRAKQILVEQSLIKRFGLFSAGICLGFFQTVIFVPDSCAQSSVPPTSGPIDIQADEQEFAESVVIAKGNVTVTCKDSVVKAPEAKLFRDPNGQPEKAIFVGHPYLTQNDSKISADTLIFEIANSKFIAQGHAHSEVSSEGDDNNKIDLKAAPNQKKLESKPVVANKTNSTNGGKQPFAWPQAADDQNTFQKPLNSASSSNTIASNNVAKESDTKPSKAKPGTAAEPEKIITDSDFQEYSKESGKFDANGNVHVIHGEISVFADKLKLVYGVDGKPETALFTGHVNAFQGSNNTQAEFVTYYLATKRLQATGNVRSRMIQQKQEGTGNTNKKVVGAVPNAGGATAAPSLNSTQSSDDPVIVVSDAQDINQNTGKMSADGNVKVYYQDMVGAGPKVLLLRNPDGRAEKVIFTERSQISQPGKRWIADRITMAIATKKVLAEGNTKAYIIQGVPAKAPTFSPAPANSALAMRTETKKSTSGGSGKSPTATENGISKNEIY
jgi:lipopolysaccharide export system protein LptA